MDNFAGVKMHGQMNATAEAHWIVECRDSNGSLKWVEEYDNLVTTEGLNLLLTRGFKTVPGDVNWYIGLKGTGSPAAGDTMASHGGWSEITPYSDSTRPAFTPGTVASGSVDNSAAKGVFNINATSTVYGAFFSTNSTKSGTSGSLYGVGDFSSSRAVINTDTISVQITLTLS